MDLRVCGRTLWLACEPKFGAWKAYDVNYSENISRSGREELSFRRFIDNYSQSTVPPRSANVRTSVLIFRRHPIITENNITTRLRRWASIIIPSVPSHFASYFHVTAPCSHNSFEHSEIFLYNVCICQNPTAIKCRIWKWTGSRISCVCICAANYKSYKEFF